MIHRALPTYAAAAFCVAFTAGRAGAQAPGPLPGKASGKEYALTHVSSFTPPPADSRNPFWPIGWVPTSPVPVAAAAAAPVLEVKAEQFTVTSISMDNPALAVIDGQTKAVGERLPVPGATAGAPEFVTVKKITDGMVVLEYKGHELSVTPSSLGAAGKRK